MLEDFDVGGNHNNLAYVGNYFWTPESNLDFPYRDIIGWGKNDYGETDFPFRYYINTNTNLNSTPTPMPGNSSPTIESGGDHTLVKGPQIFRSPQMDFNFPDQFVGGFGDTLYQTITLQNIGPDSLSIDSITQLIHPFYHNFSGSEMIEFGEDITFDIWCIYDTSHALNENMNLSLIHI